VIEAESLLAPHHSVAAGTPAQFAEFVAETAQWGKLIRETGIRAE
jgi:hypothetical protein